MIRRFLATAAVLVAFAMPLASHAQSTTYTHHRHAAPAADGTLHEYDSEDAAQAHCPSDTVVWLNTNTGIWHEKGMRWYGATKHGAYVCEREAAAAGDRDTMNGQ